LPGVGFVLILATLARLSRALPPYEVHLYAARIALFAALGLSLVWLAVSLVDGLCRGLRVLLAAALVLLIALPGVQGVAQHLALSDGLRARGVAAAWAEPVLTLLLLSVPLALWAFQRFACFRPLDFGLGLALLGLLFGLDVWLGRVQVDLSALLQTFYVLLLCALLHTAFGDRLKWLSASSCLLVVGLCLLSWLQPGLFEQGRRKALVQESSLEFVERKLLLAPRPPPLPEQPSRARCAQLLGRAAIPALELDAGLRRNVVLISIDTLRADYAGLRVHGRLLMPALVRFMSESRRASLAHTTYPATLLALSSAFRGLTVSELLLAPRLPESLFETLHARLAKVHAVLPRSRYFKRPDVRRYLLAGADVHATDGARGQTDHAIQQLRALRAAGQQHLLWIHYFEPHAPYQTWRGLEFGSTDRQRHLSELAAVDRELGRLLTVLRTEGWYGDSLIMLFADHGESFGERGHFYHHNLVYPWLLRVPFALHVPGGAAGVIRGPVQLSDVAPTVLQFLGATRPPHPMSGVPLLAAEPAADRVLVSEEFAVSGAILERYASSPMRTAGDLGARLARIERGPGYPSKLAVTRGGFELITHRGSGVVELYDVASDPGAARDLADSAAPERSELVREAARLRERLLARSLCQLESAN
jgi:arylsulfatase A-like enzyme